MRALTHTKCNWLCLSVDQVWLAVSDDHLEQGGTRIQAAGGSQ